MNSRIVMLVTVLASTTGGAAVAQGGPFSACYVPAVGAMYLIKRTGLPAACLVPAHLEIGWSDGAGAGTLTGVTAGPGLTGGTITTTGTLGVDFGGTGVAATVARSDHTHAKTGGTGVGGNTLANITSGNQNAAFGNNALASLTTGAGNTAIGQGSMDGSVNGSLNTALGSFSLRSTSGDGNTAVGHRSLTNTTSGGDNTALGDSALLRNTTGESNTAVGAGTLAFLTGGGNNTAVGQDALANATGSGNIALGFNAGLTIGSGNSNIMIGNAGLTGDDNVIRIGGAQSQTFVAGVTGATAASGIPVLVSANGKLGTSTSSARAKEAITDIGSISERLQGLRPVQFRYKPEYDDGSRLTQYGLIAEEVAQVFPELVHYAADGSIQTVRYHLLPALLLNELQRQHGEMEMLRRELAALRAIVDPARTGVR